MIMIFIEFIYIYIKYIHVHEIKPMPRGSIRAKFNEHTTVHFYLPGKSHNFIIEQDKNNEGLQQI